MISLTSPVKTRAHAWPAGVKLAALCAATLILFSFTALWFQLSMLTATAVLYALPDGQFFKTGMARLRILWPFMVLILIWHVATDDLENGAVIALRMVCAVAIANLVTMTTKLSQMVDVVTWLTTPLRKVGLQTRSLELGIALVIRFIPVLVEKGQMLAQSWRARSAKRLGWRTIIPFAVLALDDAEHVAEALRARGGL
ncbi:energy-coupling factor transporter transmembrane protein EcfT [Sulfitobacter sp. CW3]|uniref:energy-coupling factor transporter transmembrane component T family protein n=1 Tax=Sulfitobacter sp. CW3 TaxID=2861965 RepID=UPI001C5D0D53|nr:energy-coupling factor transporter transmembrane component T [Sulfitobacter sp. CW3]MBW4961410.1 energy-coupling factor transporter transmembrane protein EcfT [Sulfitobacter sp. CW3]